MTAHGFQKMQLAAFDSSDDFPRRRAEKQNGFVERNEFALARARLAEKLEAETTAQHEEFAAVAAD